MSGDMIRVPRDLLGAALHCVRKHAGSDSETYKQLSALALSDSDDAHDFEEKVAQEDRVLAAEMHLVGAQKVLTKFATRVCGWEANHRFHATDSTQISHRIGDFREARSALIRIDGYFDEQVRA